MEILWRAQHLGATVKMQVVAGSGVIGGIGDFRHVPLVISDDVAA
jgi:hypothetical protein